MALISWGNEDDKQKEDLFGSSPITHVASVQSGSWQPAPSGADSAVASDDSTTPKVNGGIFDQQQAQPEIQGNYLVSDQKAQVDERKRQNDAQVEEARRQSEARRQAAASAAIAANFKEGEAQDSQGQPLNVDEIKQDNGWKKYYDDAFKKEKDGLDFWGRLMDGGQASKRAEVMARNKYSSELINKAYDENGNTLDPEAALQARKLAAYNSALAEDNSNRSTVLARAIGATKDNEGSGFWNRVKNAVNAEKQMNIYDAFAGADDGQKTNLNDLGRFGGGLIQGIGTMPVIGAKELYESGTGHGTSAQTGFEEDLSAGERVGRGVSGALNVVTPFVGGSGKLLDSFTTKAMTKGLSSAEGAVATQLATRVATGAATQAEEKVFVQLLSKSAANAATQAEKSALAKLTSQIVLPAVEQGTIGATQAGAEYFGNGNTLTDENGNFDKNKFGELAKQTGEAGALGFAGGAILSGGAMGVNKLRNKRTPVLDAAELADLETRTTNSGEAQLSSNRLADMEGSSLKALENGDVTPVLDAPVADGIATPDTPVADGAPQASDSNVAFETPTNAADGVVAPATTSSAISRDAVLAPDTPSADGAATTLPAEVTPVRAPELQTPVETPVNANIETPKSADVTPVADGVVQSQQVVPVRDAPVVPTEQVRALQESRVGKNQAEEAAINQELQQAEAQTPRVNDPSTQQLPEGIAPVTAENLPNLEIPRDGNLNRSQSAERFMPKLADNSDMKSRIAQAVDMGKDASTPVRDILSEGGVKPKKAERIATQFDKLNEQTREYNRLTEENRKAYADGGTENLDSETSKARSRAGRELGITARRLMQDIKRLEGSKDKKIALTHGLADIIGTRNASVLTSAGLIERNIFQEITANLKLTAKNPVKMVKSTFANGNILKDTAKAELSHWGDAPKNPLEAIKYVVGNTYRTAMIPTTALANTRRGAVRDELTRWAFQELEGRKVSAKEAHKLSGTAGNEMEALVNTVIGADNGMSNRGQAKQALDSWKEYMKTGDSGARSEYLNKVEEHSSLADQMIAGISKEDAVKGNVLKSMGQLIFPFVRTAKNLAVTTVQQDLNPFARSLLDEIRVDQRSGGANTVNLIKSKLVDYGIMGGAAALASSGVLVYNDGDEVDKPRGWAIKVGDNKYIPVRATSLEMPIALAGTAQAIARDVASGKTRPVSYYTGMITGSLPYIDQFNTTTGAVDSAMGAGSDTGDGGYAAKSYGVNMAKSFVPFSNNGIQPYVAGKQGKSLNAKTVYDDNLQTWFTNAVRKGFDPNFYNGLKDSRDNAGRVRTVDNQGVISNKTINDGNTAEFNQRVTDLVNYGREAGLGQNTQDMFNSYDTGKNNNFKSVQDSITFLDVPKGADGKSTPDNAKKLEKNGKLTDLSKQIREGFYGDTGNDLLTLDGKNLYSDVSVPNKDGTKNSKLPLSMQSIKNAIAQTDLPEADRNAMYEISQKNDDLYARFKAKEMSYDQYNAAKQENEKTYTDILSNSENYKKMLGLFDELDQTGFFEANGLGATRSGQTYLWNSLNALLGSKGATPAANFPDSSKGFTPWGNGKPASNKPGDRGNTGIKWTPVGKRQQAAVQAGKYTPVNIKVKLGNEIKRDRSQNYSDRTF